MNDLPYKEGTIKLTWINPNDYSILQSKMFDTVQQALENVPEYLDKNNFLVFKLIKTDGNSYEWKLLNIGRSSEYLNGMKFRDNKLLFYGSMGLAFLGFIYLLKLVSGNS